MIATGKTSLMVCANTIGGVLTLITYSRAFAG